MGEAIDDELVEFYYQWNRFEKTNDVEIIDFDLLQRSADFPGAFNTREDAAALGSAATPSAPSSTKLVGTSCRQRPGRND